MSRKRYKRKFAWTKTYNYIPLRCGSIHYESKMENQDLQAGES